MHFAQTSRSTFPSSANSPLAFSFVTPPQVTALAVDEASRTATLTGSGLAAGSLTVKFGAVAATGASAPVSPSAPAVACGCTCTAPAGGAGLAAPTTMAGSSSARPVGNGS